MKILIVLLMSMVGTVKSFSCLPIADSDQRIADGIQITDSKPVPITTQQRMITRRCIEISSVLFFISMISAGQRKLKGHLLLIDQMHEMEEAIGELKRLNSVKDILLSIISHDVRGPLVSLESLLELTRKKEVTTNEFNHLVIEINNHVVQVKGLIDNLLYWAKENFSQIKPGTDKLALHPLVKETIGLLSFSAKKKQITILADVSEKVVICADTEMIKLVLRNLISNAIKFSNINDSVYIRVIDENEMVRVSIEDTGQGISEKNIATLFCVSHLSANGTDDEIGVGLGLTLCKEFVEKMGGNISVSSKEGKGSCFGFTVPRFIVSKRSTEIGLSVSSATTSAS